LATGCDGFKRENQPADTKALTQFGSGVYEFREAFDTNAYRFMYVVRLESAVYALHAFMKKSKSGKGLSKGRHQDDRGSLEARDRVGQGGKR
jgi:phage-related protein